MNNKSRKLSLLMDFYELTMANGYFKNGHKDTIAHYDLYYRSAPDDAVFSIAGGLGSVIEYIENLSFDEEELEFLSNKGIFEEEFIDYLRNFNFECDIRAVREGSIIFPNQPILTVRGPFVQAQLLETMLLILINHQSLIATKASRIVRAAQGRTVLEFGSRRAQGPDAANLGAKASYIAGAKGSANTLSDFEYGVPALGTMAHSWVQSFDSEYEAFKTYTQTYPNNAILLVDTYNTLKSGIPNAIKVFDEVLKPLGIENPGIRLDSGDLAYLSKEARKMLDEAGWPKASIAASNSLDEFKIRDIISQGGQIDTFGVGERLITSKSQPVFGGVYKLVAVEKDGVVTPKIKVSENVEKITTPGLKQTYRIYDKDTNKAKADLITLIDEEIDESKPLTIFHPIHTWKRTTLENFYVKPQLVDIYKNGKLVYENPSIDEVRAYAKEELDTLWDEYKRFDSPQIYKMDLSEKLWTLKNDLLNEARDK